LLSNTPPSPPENIFRLNESNAGRVQPVLDIDYVIKHQAEIQDSILKRNVSATDVSKIILLFGEAQELKVQKEKAQREREENTLKCQELLRSTKDKSTKTDEMKILKDKGKLLRDEVRDAEAKFNEINDKLVDFVLSLPNIIDPVTPAKDAKLLSETPVPKGIAPWDYPEYTAVEAAAGTKSILCLLLCIFNFFVFVMHIFYFIFNIGPGLLAEFPIGRTAWLDIQLREKAQAHLLDGDFVETGNAGYVKRQILQGAGLDPSQFLRIREVCISCLVNYQAFYF